MSPSLTNKLHHGIRLSEEWSIGYWAITSKHPSFWHHCWNNNTRRITYDKVCPGCEVSPPKHLQLAVEMMLLEKIKL